jgi:ABC-2 type transport system permease protein
MTEAAVPAATPPKAAPPAPTDRPIPPRGWLVIASKELGDHLTSARFVILLLVLGLAAGIPLYLAAEQIRQLASQVSDPRAVFLALFVIGPSDNSFLGLSLTVQSFVALAAPLLGIAFAFDAVNAERSDGTLPRLVSQPIYRDDVINGKFVAALAVITVTLVFVVVLISAFGLLRLGIAPAATEVVRLILWVAITIVYVGVWLAFATLLSVIFNRAATSALAGLGTWLLLVVFGTFLVSLILAFVVPIQSGATPDQQLATAQIQVFVTRLLPTTLYNEASAVLLNPSLTSTATLATLGQYEQAAQQIPTLLSLDQSLLLVWPHIVALIAIMALLFAAAYIKFMRQEVRA